MSSTRSVQRAPSQRSLLSRALYLALGLAFLAAGVAGYIIPGLPGTPLLLVAAWLFSMSHDGLYRWMTTNRWFGQSVADYRAGLGITRRVKSVAIGSMAVMVPLSVAYGSSSWLIRSLILVLAVIGIVFIITRPTRESTLETA